MATNTNGCADVEARIAEQLSEDISVTWCVEDVLEVDDSLSDYQARLVLRRLDVDHDATIGINWDVIEYTIGAMRRGGEL